jgi:plastocyanin
VLVAPNDAHRFSPDTLTIRAGDTVRWVWQAGGHTVTSGTQAADGRFCSPRDTTCGSAPTSSAGDTYAHTFETAGTYPYFCRPHREMMTGVIVVQ